jgi:peroxiredoxin
VVHVKVPSQDDQIQFYSASGTNLSAAEVNEISGEIRKALRKNFVPTDVEIPADFPLSEFIALGSGSSQTIALPFQLSDSSAGGDINSVTNHLLGTSEFAIAVSNEYVGTRFQAMIEKMKATLSGLHVTYAGATYSASVAYLNITWKAGSIDISGKVDITTPAWYAPNGWVTFTQTVTLELDVPTQTVALKAVGDPSVDESWWLPHGKALNAVRNARDSAFPGASQSINTTFGNARNQLISGLSRFDNYAGVRYLTIEITPDGIVLRGSIDTSGRLDPVVHFEETPDRTGFTAFRSWIPGGGIDSFEWTWQTGPAWFSLVGSSSDQHRFTVPKPPGITTANQICLRINGTRITADGFVENVTAGETCKPSWSEPVLVHPSWWMKIMIPIWGPDPPYEKSLEEATLGYINVAGQSRDPGRLTANTLVHFTGARFEKALEKLGEAMRQSQRQDGSLMMILVLPTGTFRATRREVEAKLGSLGERFAGNLILTEDYLGGWTKIFSARETPSTFFLNARREFVWNHAGEIDARVIAAALEEHMIPAPASATTLMQLNVQPGDAPPDALLEDRGETIALNRLRGQRVIINFWQSWARPCLRELKGLQRLWDQSKESATLIFGVNGGEERDVLDRVRQENNLKFPLIHDPDQTIATIFGVQCWPTTVFINREGIVERVQFGISHEHRDDITKAKA